MENSQGVINNAENTCGTNQGGCLQITNKPWIVPEEEKECRKRTRGTGDLLYIYQHTLRIAKRDERNISMA